MESESGRFEIGSVPPLIPSAPDHSPSHPLTISAPDINIDLELKHNAAISVHHRYAAIYNDDSQHLLMEDVIEAIH
jgi:hypothetical protein